MAVEQDALVRSNPFRLLEVFNRHFKLEREKGGACRNRRKGKGGVRTGEGQRKIRHRGKGIEMQKQNRKKGNHTVSCSKIRAILLPSVSVCR